MVGILDRLVGLAGCGLVVLDHMGVVVLPGVVWEWAARCVGRFLLEASHGDVNL
jgi:hypothetical protein